MVMFSPRHVSPTGQPWQLYQLRLTIARLIDPPTLQAIRAQGDAALVLDMLLPTMTVEPSRLLVAERNGGTATRLDAIREALAGMQLPD